MIGVWFYATFAFYHTHLAGEEEGRDLQEEKARIREGCDCSYGKVHENRPYSWVYQQEEGEEPDFDAPPPYDQLLITSVRIYDGMDVPIARVIAPDDFDPDVVENPGSRHARARKTHHGGGPAPVLSPFNAGALISRDSEEYKLILGLLPGVRLTNAFKEGDGQSSVYWVWSRNRVCENKGAEHERNNVWYEINRNGVFQRCFDSECRGYRSEPRRLPLCVADRLFRTRPSDTGRKTESPMSSAGERLMYRIAYDPKKARGSRRGKRGRGAF
eukprot:jgi/Mesvir1/26746/Mv20522-RA.1